VFVAVIVVAAVIAGFLWFGTDGATAIDVGGAKVSAQSVNDELRVVAGAQTPGADDRRVDRLPAERPGRLADRLQRLIDHYLAQVGERITGPIAPRREPRSVTNTFAKLPKWFQDRYVARFAAFAAFSRLKGDPNDQNAELRAVRGLAKRRASPSTRCTGAGTRQGAGRPWSTPAHPQGRG